MKRFTKIEENVYTYLYWTIRFYGDTVEVFTNPDNTNDTRYFIGSINNLQIVLDTI